MKRGQGTVARRSRACGVTPIAATALLATGLLALPARAQQGEPQAPAPAEAQGKQLFEAEYFRSYNPVTAADMVARVPGFEISDGDDRRGFGATAGNVLVNGERPSSKATISEQLKRIPADAVLRLELLSGSAGSADARGQSRLVNVVLRPTAKSSPTTWVLGLRHLQYSNRIGYTAQASKSLRLAPNLDLSLDLQAPNLRGRSEGFEAVRTSAGSLSEYRETYQQPIQTTLQVASNLKWRASAQDTLNVNLLYAPTEQITGIASVVHLSNGALKSETYGGIDYTDSQRGEFGGDWEHRFSDRLSVKVVGLATFSTLDQVQMLDTYVATGLSNTQVQTTTAETGERVLRGVLSWGVSDAHTLEIGGEGAFNFRDTTLALTNRKPGGQPVPVIFPVADTRVEEQRGEAFVTDVWRITKRLTLETGFTFEGSRITQTGDAAKEREFSYPKPQIAATWQAGEGSIVRLSLRRDIAQLDFAEFASSFNFIDATTIVGNPDLEPEKSWKAKIEWDRRFGKQGAFTAGLFHDEVQDVRDLVVIGTNDAYGNLGDGVRTGLEFRGFLPLDRFGLPHAELRVNGVYQHTSVTDPLTGEKRSFSSGDNSAPAPRSGGSSGGPPPLNVGNRDWGYVASYRQEFPSLKSAVSFSVARNAMREEFKRIEHITQDRSVERLDLNWETTAIPGITLRLGLGNFLSPPEDRVRTFYAPDRTGTVVRTETRRNKGGPDGSRTYSIQASGKF